MPLKPEIDYHLTWIGPTIEGKKSKEKLVKLFFQEYIIKNEKIYFLKKEIIQDSFNITYSPNLIVGAIYRNRVLSRNDLSPVDNLKVRIDIQKGVEKTLREYFNGTCTRYFGQENEISEEMLDSIGWHFVDVPIRDYDKVKNVKNLFIPNYEIIKYYYGRDSRLYHALFNGSLAIDKEIHYQEYLSEGSSGNPPLIVLGKKMRNSLAPYIGRMVLDEHANLQARRIYDSVSDGLRNKKNAYPSCGFPFLDQTTLTINCKRIWSDPYDKDKNPFPFLVVTEILGCSHQFPFKKLDFLRINDARKVLKESLHDELIELKKTENQVDTSNFKKEIESKIKAIDEEENADSELAPEDDVNIVINDVQNLPEVRQLEKETQKTIRQVHTTWVENLERTRSNYTDSYGNKKLLNAIVNEGLVDSVDDPLIVAKMNRIVVEFKKKGYSAKLLNENGGKNSYSFFPYEDIIKQNRAASKWFLINGTSLVRKCWIIECYKQGLGYFYIVEIEKRFEKKKEGMIPMEHFMIYLLRGLEWSDLRQPNDNNLKMAPLNEFLFDLAIARGVWGNAEKKPDKFRVGSVRHYMDDDRIEKMFEVLEQLKRPIKGFN